MRKQLLALFLLLVLPVGCGTPSQHSASPSTQGSAVSLVEHRRTRDLRTLFRTSAVIQALEDSHACLVHAASRGSHSFEKRIGNGLYLEQLVKQLYGKSYDGQMKVISRDSIVQTSLVEYNPSKQAEMFISPGDLVFILGRE